MASLTQQIKPATPHAHKEALSVKRVRLPLMWLALLAEVMLPCSLPMTTAIAQSSAPSRFGVDAPQLAALGEYPVGFRTIEWVAQGQADVLRYDSTRGTAPLRDRRLVVDIWYPAQRVSGARPMVYQASLPSEPPATAAKFSIPGIAVRDAALARRTGGYPLVVVSHGYSNDPLAMTWLTENLASKGYVVAAIRHEDPPITDLSKLGEPLMRRPLDIVFVTQMMVGSRAGELGVDPARIALIGYSMGGYGVLTVAGASLDPHGPPASRFVPGGLLTPFTRGGAQQASVTIEGLKAVVALAPAGGGSLAAWGAQGLLGIKVPLLLIAGDADRTVDYAQGAQAIFAGAVHAPRYLLTFEGAGHAIGLNPVPDAMRGRLWDQDWFEDPVWRKERVNAINDHFITAFLDLYVKGETDRAAFLDVPVEESSAGAWPASADRPAAAYAAYSDGGPGNSYWKGFQRNHAAGLKLQRAQALP